MLDETDEFLRKILTLLGIVVRLNVVDKTAKFLGELLDCVVNDDIYFLR